MDFDQDFLERRQTRHFSSLVNDAGSLPAMAMHLKERSGTHLSAQDRQQMVCSRIFRTFCYSDFMLRSVAGIPLPPNQGRPFLVWMATRAIKEKQMSIHLENAPSKTGNPSGGGRGNNPPRSSVFFGIRSSTDAAFPTLNKGIHVFRPIAIALFLLVPLSLTACSTTGPRYHNVRSYSEGLAPVQSSNGRWGYIDEQQRWVIPPRFEEVREFQGGRAAVRQNGRWGFINKRGAWL